MLWSSLTRYYSIGLDIFRYQCQLNSWLRWKTHWKALWWILQWWRRNCTSSKYSPLITWIIFSESCKHASSEISCCVKLCIVYVTNQLQTNSTANILWFKSAIENNKWLSNTCSSCNIKNAVKQKLFVIYLYWTAKSRQT